MAEEGKKISFGFAKSIKKPVLNNLQQAEVKKVDFIKCLDDKSIKIIREEEKEAEPLVISLPRSNVWHYRVRNKVNADIFETKVKASENVASKATSGPPNIANGKIANEECLNTVKQQPSDEKPLSLEEQAVQEILKDLGTEIKEERKEIKLSLTVDNLSGHDESSVDNYEQIPIKGYGLAMLTGMGWKLGKGIAKNGQFVEPKIPELRPRCMGLGTDTAVKKKNDTETATKTELELKLVVGAFVKVNQGKFQGHYGQLEGLHDSGTIIVKLALRDDSVTINGGLIEPVTKEEYHKNSKVLNTAKYEEFKNKEATKCQKTESKSKSSRSRKRRSDSSDDDRRSRRKRSSTSDSASSASDSRDYRDYKDHRRRKSKKKEKHDSSSSSDDVCERRSSKSKKSSKRNKKKEKTRG